MTVLLDKGRIVARGTHEELMESSPIYAEIYYSQLHGEKELMADKSRRTEFAV